MQQTIVKAPCETCLKKNGIDCLKVAAMLRTAHVIETELYNHGIVKLVSNISIQCKNYLPDSQDISQ